MSYARTDEPGRINAHNGLDERVKVSSSDGWTTTVRNYVDDLDHRLVGEEREGYRPPTPDFNIIAGKRAR